MVVIGGIAVKRFAGGSRHARGSQGEKRASEGLRRSYFHIGFKVTQPILVFAGRRVQS